MQVKKKRGIAVLVRNLADSFKNIFKDYPVTLVAIVLLALVGAIIIEDYDGDAFRIIAEFLLVFIPGALFSEQLLGKKIQSIKWPFFVAIAVNILIALFFTWEFELDEPWFFGADYEKASMQLTLILAFIILVESMCSLYSMYRISKVKFDQFCLNAFTELFKTSVIYSVFAVGFLIIVEIFNVLIFDTDEFVVRIEIFLLGSVLAPLAIKAVSSVKAEATKFAKVMVLYVLTPLLTLAYVVIYIYIVKLIITLTLPSNQVFNIVAFLFSIGMPIWTMSQFFKDTFIGKISKMMPYAFIPLMILQLLCMIIRISDYGITESRYFGMLLIIFELIYLVLYLMQHIKNKEYVRYSFLIVPVLHFFGTLAPGINAYEVSVRSQAKIFSDIYNRDHDSLTKDEKNIAYSAYWEISRTGWQGEEYIAQHYNDKKVKREIDDWYQHGDYTYRRTEYINYYTDHNDYDISEYSHLYCDYVGYDDDMKDIDDFSSVVLRNSRIEELPELEVDISDYISELIDFYEDKGFGSNYLDKNDIVKVGKYTLIVKRVSLDYSYSGEVESFNISVDILE